MCLKPWYGYPSRPESPADPERWLGKCIAIMIISLAIVSGIVFLTDRLTRSQSSHLISGYQAVELRT